MESRDFLNKRQKRGQQIFIDTADKVMIPVAFCFWATEEDLRLEHIPWLTWWDVIGSSSRACSQYYGVFRLPSSPQFLEVTAVCPAPWHFLRKKKKKERKKRETFEKNPVTVTYVNATETCLFNSSRHVLCSLTASSLFSTHGQFFSSNMTFLGCTSVILTYLYN